MGKELSAFLTKPDIMDPGTGSSCRTSCGGRS